MSEQSVEIVRKVVTAFWPRPPPDWETLNKLVHPDHELHSLVEAMEGGHARGEEGGRDFRERWDETGGDWSVEIEDDLAPEGVAAIIREAGYRSVEWTHELVADVYALLMARRRRGQKGRPPWLDDEIWSLMRRVAEWDE